MGLQLLVMTNSDNNNYKGSIGRNLISIFLKTFIFPKNTRIYLQLVNDI